MKIRLFLAILALTFFSLYTSRAHAEDMASAVEAFELPISQGHWKIGGGFSYTKDGDTWFASVSPEAEYFLIDRLSVGADVTSYWSSYGTRATSLGPAFSYYFATNDHWAFFVRQTLAVQYSDYRDTRTSGTSAIGATYFFNEHVGFSPSLRASYGKDQTGYFTGMGSFNIFF